MAAETVKGERSPLGAPLYHLVQKVANHGIIRRYLPPRAAALDWEHLEESRILEVGCGTGAIPSRGVATDLDPRRVRFVAKQGRVGVVADGRKLPFLDRSFSVVYCEGVLHHIDDAGAIALVAEMLRVCRPTGRVVVMDSVWPTSPFRILAWILRWADFGRHVRSEAELRQLLRSAGGELQSAQRMTYTTIGLEALLSVLVPLTASKH
jgi:ubiquinone/menaquinone biosynthesis C-methylase UbiE